MIVGERKYSISMQSIGKIFAIESRSPRTCVSDPIDAYVIEIVNQFHLELISTGEKKVSHLLHG